MKVANKLKSKKLFTLTFTAIYVVQLFAPLTVTLNPQIAHAEENPCQVLPESSPNISTDYGGVELDEAAEFLANMDDVTGAYYDEDSNRIVFIGTATTTLPEFDKDDLAVAIKAVIFNGANPAISIDFKDVNDPEGYSNMDVVFTGGVEDTNFGHDLFNADIALKEFMLGYDENENQITSSVSGYESVLTKWVANGPDTSKNAVSRYWISPDTVTLKEATSSDTFVFDDVVMHVQTEALAGNMDPAWTDASDDFVQHQTDNYDEFAEEVPAYAKVKQLAKIVGVVKWIKDKDIGVDFEWAKHYETIATTTPDETPLITTPLEGGYYAFGGVEYTSPNTYQTDTQGTSTQLQSDSEAAATSSTNGIHWTFSSDGETYDAVSVSAELFRSTGAYNYNATDVSAPTASPQPLELMRSYSSFTGSDIGFGPGWDFFPASMDNLKPGEVSAVCNYWGVFNITAPTKIEIITPENGRETFSFTCPTTAPDPGYIPDDTRYHSSVVPTPSGANGIQFNISTKTGTDYDFYAHSPTSTEYRLIRYDDVRINPDPGGGDDFVREYKWDSSTTTLLTIQDIREDQSASTTFNGSNLAFNYNGSNQITSVVGPRGTTTYGYDSNGDLVTVVDMRGNTTTYAYGDNHLLESITDRGGTTYIQNEYDALGRVATQTNAHNLVKTIDYDDENVVITWSDDNSRTGSSKYDEEGRIIETTDALGATTKYFYTSTSTDAPTSIVNANGATTTFTYDEWGDLTSTTDTDSNTITFTLGGLGEIEEVSDPRYTSILGSPRLSKYDYDFYSLNVSQSTIAGQGTTTYTYTNKGQLASTTDSNGDTEHYYYDNRGLLALFQDKLGNETSYSYNNAGDLTQVADSTGATTTYTYDANGNRLTTTNAVSTISYAYDANDRLTSVIDPTGATTTFAYSSAGTLATTTDPLGASTHYYYDEYNNLIKVTDALSRDIEYTYDAVNRETAYELASGKTYTNQYDLLGNPTVVAEPNGVVATSTYDSLNRLTSAVIDGESFSYTYDDASRLSAVTNNTGTTTYTYDARDRVTEVENSYGAIVKYEYDDLNNITKVTYPDNKTVQNQFDDAGQLTQQTDWNNDVTTYTYTDLGSLSTTTLPNDITIKRAYDSAGRLASVTHRDSSQNIIFREVYTRDAEGNLIEIDEDGNAISTDEITYDYDLAGRVTRANSATVDETYEYDQVGNLTELDDGATTTTYTHTVDNEISTSTDTGGGEMAMMGGGGSFSLPTMISNAFAYVVEKPFKLVTETYELAVATIETTLLPENTDEYEEVSEQEVATNTPSEVIVPLVQGTSTIGATEEATASTTLGIESTQNTADEVTLDTDTQTSTPSVVLEEENQPEPVKKDSGKKDKYKETSKEYVLDVDENDETAGKVKIAKDKPAVTFEKWDGEVNMTVGYQKIDASASRVSNSDTIEWKETAEEVHAYPLPATKQMENGGFEIEVVLNEKPDTNIFDFSIDGHQNLDFFYQPPLDEDEGTSGMCTQTQCVDEEGEVTEERPENIVGSYAVYHKTKKNNLSGEMNYQSGKAYHIFRPQIIDANNEKVWGELDYSDGTLSVTVPQDFLDTAAYPVIVDPTFGYTSAGGSSATVRHDFRGSLFTSPSDYSSFDSMHLYCDTTTSSYDLKGMIVDHSSLNLVTNGVSNAATCNTTGAWKTLSFSTNPSLSASTEYLLGGISDSPRVQLKYDSGSTNQGHYDGTNSYTSPQNLGSASHDNRKYSAYITYTASGGGGNATPTAPTLLETEGQTNPTNITDSTPEFTAIYNDADSGDKAVYYEIEVDDDSGFGSTIWDSGKSSLATTTAGNRTGDITYGGSALASSTTYYWRIKFWDDDDAEGAWSTTTATFSLAAAPSNNAPTAPTLLETEGFTNPTNVTDSTPEFTAIYNDPDSGDSAVNYQVQVDDNSDFSSTIWDSTKTALATTTQGNRTGDISYAGTALASSTTYYWRIKFWDDDDAEGAWSTVTATFSLDAGGGGSNATPTAPTLLETEGQTNPTDITDSTPEFTAIYNDPDSGDIATHYQIQVATSTAFTNNHWDSGSTTLASSTSQGNRIADISYSGTALASSTTYYWRIKFWDDDGLEGDWSTSTASFSLAAGSGGGGSSDTTYTYDDSGNLLSAIKGSFSKLFTWNPLGLLSSVSVDGALTSFSYDAEGNRIEKVAPGTGGGGGSQGGTVIFSDTFTESSDTYTTSHTPDVGDSWTTIDTSGSGSGNSVHVQASSDTLRGAAGDSSAGVMYSADTTYSTADYQVKLKMVNAPTGDEYLNIGLRMDSSANNGYLLEGWWGDNHDPAIYRVSSGSFTQLATYDSTDGVIFGDGDVIVAEISGNDIAMYGDDEVAHIYTTDSTHTSANKAAIGFGAYQSSGGDIETTVPVIDDLEVIELADNSTGWNNPSTSGETDNDWINPTNAYSSNNSRTTIDADTHVGTGAQDYGDFGFSIDSGATIEGIEVKVESLTDGSGYHDLAIAVSNDNGSSWSSEKTIRYEDFDSNDGTKIAGHAFSLWGETWEPSDLSNSDFRVKVRLAAREGSTVDDLGIDNIAVKVFYDTGSGGTATTTTRYINDTLAPNALVLAEADEENTIQRYNVWGPDGLVSTGEASSTERYYPITDHHGSVRLLTDSSGNVVNSYTYTPYGEVTASSSSPTIPYLYTSEQQDETGLIYLRARYYDPELGRFISRDPFRGTINTPLSQNPYQYALDNPVMHSDPSGKFVPALWALTEVGLSIADAYTTYRTLTDPCASDIEKSLTSSLFLAGIYSVGGGGAALLKFGNVGGGVIPENAVLDVAEDWLGAGYKEIAPGVYRSADNRRQFRMTNKDLAENEVHLEVIGPDGREIIENAHYIVE